MKKIIATMLVLLLLTVGFAGCGGGETPDPEMPIESETPEMPIESEVPETPENDQEEPLSVEAEDDVLLKSVIFAESDSILSLGDERALFDSVLGEGVEDGDIVSYLDGTFNVRFRDGAAITFIRMWEFERIVFPAFDATRSVSSIMRDLMFDPFFEHPNAEHVYLAPLEIGAGVYVLQITMGLTNGELSHVESITLNVFDG